MASQGVDAVHLVCRAHGGDDTAQLWLSGSLAADDTALVLIDQDELCLLLDRAGAWALTMVPVVRAQAGALAFVADGVAHHRPGAVLFHAIDDPEDEIALRAACAFLFAGQPSPAPALRDGFLYCHPSFVAADTGAASAQAASAAADVGLLALQASQPQSGRGPDWIGSAQRFVESAALEQVRKVGSDVLLSGALSKRTPPDAASSGAASTSSVATLSAIRNVVQDFLKTEPKE